MAKRILIVEDEAILAKGLGQILKRNGFEVASPASSGEEAVRLALETKPDLILMDIRLSGKMDGIAAAQKLSASANIPVIYLTAYSDEETLQRAMISAPYGYLVKPLDERLTLITIKMALGKHEAEELARQTLEQLRHANIQLEYQKGFFKTLFDSITDGVLVVGSDFKVRAANPQVERMLGIPAHTAPDALEFGRVLACKNMLPGESHCLTGCEGGCQIRRAIGDAFTGNTVQRTEFSFQVMFDGQFREKKLLVGASAMEYDGEKLCILILEDVTELAVLRHLFKTQHSFADIVGSDPKILDVFKTIVEVSGSSVPVLIEGESGTGKELVALAIHKESPRSKKPFVAVNCGALPDGLLESELFGHVRGAFTGAIKDKKGRFELAHGGTLFLDEIGELGTPMQVKLLRALQEGCFEPVGSESTIRVDVRIISATNRDLQQDILAGRFRSDLFYRLCVVPIHLPPLRERREDIPIIAEHIIQRIANEREISPARLSKEAIESLLAHRWHGNVRELENALQYALLKSHGKTIRPGHFPPSVGGAPPRPPKPARTRAKKLNQNAVEEALRAANGNRVMAAKALGVSRATLYRFLDSSDNPQSAR